MDCLILSDQGRDCLLSLCSTGSENDGMIEVTKSGTEDMNVCSLNSYFLDNKPTQASDPGCESLIDELLQWCSPCDDEDSHFTQGMFLNSCDMKDSLGVNNDHYFDQLLDLGENAAPDQQNEPPCIFSNSNDSQESEQLINCELDLFDCGVLEELMGVKSANNSFTCFNSLQKNSAIAGHWPGDHSNCVFSCLGSPYPNLGKRVIPSHRCSLKGETENSLCVPEVHRGYGGDFSPHLFSPTQRQHNFMNNPNEYLHDYLPSFTSLSQPGSSFSVRPSSAKNAVGFNCSPQNNEIPLPFHLLFEPNEHNNLVNFAKETRISDSSSFCSWKQGLSIQNSCAHVDNDESDESKSKLRRISVLAKRSEIQNMLKERSKRKTYDSSLLRSESALQHSKNLCNKNNERTSTTKDTTDVVQKRGNINVTQSIIKTCLKKNIIWTVGKRDKLIRVSSKDMRKFAVRDLLKISGNWEYKTMKEETRELKQDRGLLLQKKKERLRELNKVGQNKGFCIVKKT